MVRLRRFAAKCVCVCDTDRRLCPPFHPPPSSTVVSTAVSSPSPVSVVALAAAINADDDQEQGIVTFFLYTKSTWDAFVASLGGAAVTVTNLPASHELTSGDLPSTGASPASWTFTTTPASDYVVVTTTKWASKGECSVVNIDSVSTAEASCLPYGMTTEVPCCPFTTSPSAPPLPIEPQACH